MSQNHYKYWQNANYPRPNVKKPKESFMEVSWGYAYGVLLGFVCYLGYHVYSAYPF